MNAQLTQDLISIAGTVIVLGLGYLAKQKGWLGSLARKIEPVIDPAVQVVEDLTHNAKAVVVIHDVQSALAATTKRAQDAYVQAEIAKYALAAKVDIASLTPTQIGGLTASIVHAVPASWRSVVTPTFVADAIKAAEQGVTMLASDPSFQAVQQASAVIHA